MHTASQPPELELPTIEAPTPPKAPRAQTNHLTLKQNSLLYIWLDQPENREYVAKNSDNETAIRATNALNFLVTVGNIAGTRHALEIKKIKPEPPPSPAQDTDLIALHQQLKEHGLQCEALRIEARTTREAVNLLVAHIMHCEAILVHMGLGTVPTEINMAGLRGLPALNPLAETAKAA